MYPVVYEKARITGRKVCGDSREADSPEEAEVETSWVTQSERHRLPIPSLVGALD